MDKISDVSFVVGVTGHRDLAMDNEAAVSEQIDTFLTELQTALGPFPVTIACGMADGADRLVAHRALKLGIAVQAVLPMPTRYYLSDFSTDSAEELETLLAHENVSLHEIPLPAETSSVAISEPSAARDRLYGRLRDWLLRHSNLMLGLWDGGLDRPEGGTADVLLSYLFAQPDHSGKLEFTTLNFVKDAPILSSANVVAWIEVGRQSTTEPKFPGLSYLLPASEDQTVVVRTEKLPKLLLQRLAGLKEHFEAFAQLKESDKTPPVYGLLDGLSGEPPAPLKPILTRIDTEFERADALAIRNQAS